MTQISKNLCKKLMLGEIGLGNSPIFRVSSYWSGFRIVSRIRFNDYNDSSHKIRNKLKSLNYKDFATKDYVENFMHSIERSIYLDLCMDPMEYMLGASYVRNELVDGSTLLLEKVVLSKIEFHEIVGTIWCNTTFNKNNHFIMKKDTIFDKFPLLSFVKNKLNKEIIYKLCKDYNLDFKLSYMNCKESSGNIVVGVMSYSDASSIQPMSKYIYTDYDCYI